MAVYMRRSNPGGTILSGVTSSSGAPSLTGLAGSLVAVLDYCLTDATYGCGWTKAYSGTNQAVYRSPVGTNQFYLYVDDTLGQNAALRGYESMSSISSGTGAFPTTAQLSAGDYLYKSASADSTTRAWQFLSNGKIFYFFAYNSGTGSVNGMAFGDFISYKASDAFNTILIGNTGLSATSTSVVFGSNASNNIQTTQGGIYLPRAYTQIGSAISGSIAGDATRSNNSPRFGSGGPSYPNPITGGLDLANVLVGESAGARGFLPGLWFPLHNRPFNAGDTFTGANDLAGRTFEVVYTSGDGMFCFETSDTWATS